MSEIIEKMSKIAKNRPAVLKQAKSNGKKVIEHTGSFVPEELIYAAGAKPYLMCRGGEPEPPESPLSYLLRFMNPLARSLAGYHMLGLDPVTPFADIIAFQETDCQVGRVSELMEYMKMPVYKLGVPADWNKDLSREYYYRALEKFKNRLEELTGTTIDDVKLLEQIKLSNKIHDSLQNINELRKKENPPITGYDFMKINHFSFFMDPEEAIEQLEALYLELKDKEGAYPKQGPRLLVAGHAVAIGDYVVTKMIEDNGGLIVSEMMDEGIRHFNHKVSTEGDLLRNIGVRNYVDKLPANIFQPSWKERFEYMKKIIEEFNIDGVIWYQLAFDEIYNMESACIAKWLSEIKVPFMKLETSYEYSRESMGPLETRIESFIESIK